MGLFGRKKPEAMGYDSALAPPPGYMGGMGIGDGMIERQQMGGYNQNAAMQGQSGFQGQSLPQKPKFFGEGGTGRAIAGTIGDFLMQNAGMAPVYRPTMQRRQDEESQFRYAGQKRQQDRENFLFEESYKRQNPMPANDQLTRYMTAAGIDPMSDQGKAMYAAAATNEAYPERAVPYTDEQGNSGLRFIRSGMPPQQQSAVQEGATATNPQTGEKVIFRNGAWQAVGGGGSDVTSGF